MPERVYKGGHAAVEVEVEGKTVLVHKGGPAVKVDEATAKEMDASDAWGKPGPTSKEKE